MSTSSISFLKNNDNRKMGEIEAYNDPKGEGPEATKMVIMEEVKEKKKLPKRRKTPAITIRKEKQLKIIQSYTCY